MLVSTTYITVWIQKTHLISFISDITNKTIFEVNRKIPTNCFVLSAKWTILNQRKTAWVTNDTYRKHIWKTTKFINKAQQKKFKHLVPIKWDETLYLWIVGYRWQSGDTNSFHGNSNKVWVWLCSFFLHVNFFL